MKRNEKLVLAAMLRKAYTVDQVSLAIKRHWGQHPQDVPRAQRLKIFFDRLLGKDYVPPELPPHSHIEKVLKRLERKKFVTSVLMPNKIPYPERAVVDDAPDLIYVWNLTDKGMGKSKALRDARSPVFVRPYPRTS